VDNLKFSIDSSIGKTKQISIQSYKLDQDGQSFDYWRFLRILEDSFLEQAETGDLLLCANKKNFSIKNMKVPHHVDRVFVIFKLNEANNEVIAAEHDKVHILRICAQKQAIILESWNDFKKYRQDKFTDLIFRRLNVERDGKFLDNATKFVEDILRTPYINCQELIIRHTEAGPVQVLEDRKRSYKNAEIAFRFYMKVEAFLSPVLAGDPTHSSSFKSSTKSGGGAGSHSIYL